MGPSNERRTVLNLSQAEEGLFDCGTYWFIGIQEPGRKQNILK